ncbi:PstS ABC-type phosphate transport system, periplasmic component [Burkholderiales bacterium]
MPWRAPSPRCCRGPDRFLSMGLRDDRDLSHKRHIASVVSPVTQGFALSICPFTDKPKEASLMRKTLISSLIGGAALAFSMTAAAADITGAGATFPYPIFAKWAEDYKKATGTGLNYQSIGSSGGIRQIRAKTVTFGASDAPVKGADLDKDGMVQFPVILGGVVPIMNLDGFQPGELKVTGEVLAEMFMGWIVNWNDPKIAALNPGKKLPDQTITVVHRADGSGTTFIFTDYLNEVSKLWAEKVGKGAAVKWPAASSVGGKGNEGVAANVGRVKGAIGYVEYAYAKKNKIPYFQLANRDGKYVRPDDVTFAAAAAGADWFSVPGMGISLVNQKGADSWPITGASFALMYKQPTDKAASAEVIKFFDWAFTNGKKQAADLDYVPLPDALTSQIRSKVWSQIANK